MKTIKIQFQEKTSISFDVACFKTESRNIFIREQIKASGPLLLVLTHGRFHALLDFTKAEDFQLLAFNKKNKFIGASLAISNEIGFIWQTQADKVLIIPIDQALEDAQQIKGYILS